jgi:nucleoside-diphosphate-sugar epimerase
LLEIHKTGTEHLVNACLHHRVSHFVYISSISTLGRESEQATLNENSAWVENEFSTGYGLSKYLGELESWRAAAEGLNVTAILPSVILGTGDWHRSSLQMFSRIASGPGYFPSGQTGFVDVRDVVSFIQLVLEKSNSGERWLINGANISYGNIYRLVADQMGLKKSFSPAPKWLANILLRSGNLLKSNSLGTEILRHTYGTYSYDNAKSLSVEGFQYRPIEVILQEIAAAYRNGASGPPLRF